MRRTKHHKASKCLPQSEAPVDDIGPVVVLLLYLVRLRGRGSGKEGQKHPGYRGVVL